MNLTTRKQVLTYDWDFCFTEIPLTEISISDLAYTDKMPVPGCFDAKGKYRFKRGCGVYRTSVTCGGLVKLEVGAVGLRGEVYFDGKKLGSLLKPFTAEDFIFEAGENGAHELVIVTENIFDETPSSMFQPNYDFYAYGGIYRKVTLTELPAAWVEHVAVLPLDLQTGEVEIRLTLGGDWQHNRAIDLAFDGGEKFQVTADSAQVVLRRCVPNPKIWSLSTPVLHRLQVQLGEDRREVTFGLRQIGLKDGQITLNGQPIKLIGFNRHDAHPEHGYAIPSGLTLADLEMIKNTGYNFVRGCHYAQSEEMLDMCDRLGLLVWDESLGWGNLITSLTDPVFCKLQIEQTAQMVRRSINHPCIALWGFLNEAETNLEGAPELVKSLVEAIKAEDPSRLVTFASNKAENDLCLDYPDVISFNTYPGWYWPRTADQEFHPEAVLDDLRRLANHVSQERYRNKGLLIGEIGAAAIIGDHSGLRWSEEYQWELLETVLDEVLSSDRWSGVAFWQFCNTKTYSDVRSLMRPRGFNNKGVLTEYREPKLAWRKLAERMAELKNKL